MRRASIALGLVLLAAACSAGETKVVDSMDSPTGWRKKAGTALALDAKPHEGAGALAIKVKAKSRFTTAMRIAKPDAAWNDYDGLSFWVKGDGSNNVASIALQAGKWGNDWMAPVPLKNTEWHQVAIAWSDFVPYNIRVPALGSADGFKPGDVTIIHLGAFLNRTLKHEIPGLSFSIDDIRLVRGVKSKRPRVGLDKLTPLDTVVAKMKAGKPVTVVTVGDSITWGTSAGGNRGAYPAHLQKMLRKHYGNESIRVVNRAIGGSTTSKHRFWLERDIRGIEADLVTMMFGYNERLRTKTTSEVTAKVTAAYVANLVTYIEEVAATMKTPPAVMPIAPTPGRKANWLALDGYAQAVRELCRKHKTLTVIDANGYFKAIGAEKYPSYMADEAHPNRKGQQEMAKLVFRAITGGGAAK
jgi:lysophospholipase L1-like esterase